MVDEQEVGIALSGLLELTLTLSKDAMLPILEDVLLIEELLIEALIIGQELG